jgi:hypothetical protein
MTQTLYAHMNKRNKKKRDCIEENPQMLRMHRVQCCTADA